MIELSRQRIEQILHEETAKREDLDMILRGIYTRYMRLYEKYFSDIDALNDDVIAGLRNYHEETSSLMRHYYMDIPLDICMGLEEFDDRYGANLLGSNWHAYLFDCYEKFKETNRSSDKSEELLKAEFAKQNLTAFYYAMDCIFRDGFGTGSNSVSKVLSGITGLLFGEE